MLAVGEVGRAKQLSDFFSVLISPFALRCLSLDCLVIIDNAGYEQMNIKQCLAKKYSSFSTKLNINDLKCKILGCDKNLRFIFCRADTEQKTFRFVFFLLFLFSFGLRNFPWPSNRHSRSTSGWLRHPPKKINKKACSCVGICSVWCERATLAIMSSPTRVHTHIFFGAGRDYWGVRLVERETSAAVVWRLKTFPCLSSDGRVSITRPIFPSGFLCSRHNKNETSRGGKINWTFFIID